MKWQNRNSFTYGANYTNFITWSNTNALCVYVRHRKGQVTNSFTSPSTRCVFIKNHCNMRCITVMIFLRFQLKFVYFQLKWRQWKVDRVWKRHHLDGVYPLSQCTYSTFNVNKCTVQTWTKNLHWVYYRKNRTESLHREIEREKKRLSTQMETLLSHLACSIEKKKTSTDSFNNFDPVDELYLSLESLALIGILYVFNRQSVHEKGEKNQILNRFEINSSCCFLSCLKFFNIIFKVLILFDILFLP